MELLYCQSDASLILLSQETVSKSILKSRITNCVLCLERTCDDQPPTGRSASFRFVPRQSAVVPRRSVKPTSAPSKQSRRPCTTVKQTKHGTLHYGFMMPL